MIPIVPRRAGKLECGRFCSANMENICPVVGKSPSRTFSSLFFNKASLTFHIRGVRILGWRGSRGEIVGVERDGMEDRAVFTVRRGGEVFSTKLSRIFCHRSGMTENPEGEGLGGESKGAGVA